MEVSFTDVILSRQNETRKLIVSTQEGTVTTKLTDRLINKLDFDFMKKTQDVSYTGTGYFVVDLDDLTAANVIEDRDKKTVTILIGHAYLQAIEIDYIDESEVLSPADDVYHIDKTQFDVPFVCGAKNLGEALRRIEEGASMIRTKGEPGTGDVIQAVRHMRTMNRQIRELVSLRDDEVYEAANMVKELVHPDANTIFGATFDDSLGDEIRVTVIATGFDEKRTLDPVTAVIGRPGDSSKDKFDSLFLKPRTDEERKAEEKDPFDDIMRIFNNDL